VALNDELRAAIRKRGAAVDANADWLFDRLQGMADDLGREVRNLVGARGDDAAVRARILSVRLDDVLDVLDDAGLGAVREGWIARHRLVAQASAEAARGAGLVNDADAALDQEALRIAMVEQLERTDVTFWEGRIERPSAYNILEQLHRQALAGTLEDAADQIAAQFEIDAGQARTLAVTEQAIYDRFVSEELAQEAGGDTLRGYVGPLDGITRPFCQALAGKAFDVGQVASLDNGQIGGRGGPIHSGGGYNCRHGWVTVHPDDVADLGFVRGTGQDVTAANGAAGAGRKKGP